MKALTEIITIWGTVVAVILGVFLLNFWMVHHIEILIGAKATLYIIGFAIIMATGWVFGTGAKK